MLVFTLFLDDEFLGVYQLKETAQKVAISYIDAKYPTSRYLNKRTIRSLYSFNGAGIQLEHFVVSPGPPGTFRLIASKLDQFVRL